MLPEEKEANLKKIRNIKPTKGFFLVKIDQELVIPADDFPKFIDSLQNAKRKLNKYYSDKPGLGPLCSDDMVITSFSRAEYEAYQMAMLLNLDRDGTRALVENLLEDPS